MPRPPMGNREDRCTHVQSTPGRLERPRAVVPCRLDDRVLVSEPSRGQLPYFFDKTRTHRWDSPDGDFGVLYLGGDEYSAFMESIGRGALKTRFIPSSQPKGTALAKI